MGGTFASDCCDPNKEDSELPDEEARIEYYRVNSSARFIPNLPEVNILNSGTPDHTKLNKSAVEMSMDFDKTLLCLEGLYWEPEGIQYTAMKDSEEFQEYTHVVRDLQLVNLKEVRGDDLKAFFINIYNALVIHGTIVTGQPKTQEERKNFFNCTAYQIGKYVFSLEQIEHGILRGNALQPRWKQPYFEQGDPRRRFVCDLDCRVHFSLVCGSKSCPPVRFYKADTLDKDLDRAGESFILQEEIPGDDNTVSCSQILEWYRSDFTGEDGSDAALLKAVRRWMNEDQKRAIDAMTDPKLTFREYDWSLNGH